MAPRLKTGGPGIPLILIGIGGYLAWFGVHYWRADTAWPSDPVKAVLTGKPIPAAVRPGADYSELTTSVVGPGELAGKLGAAAVGGSAAPAGGTYDKASLISLWSASGGDPATANVAAAVALAESSGRPAVTSPNPDGGTNVGLWQLDTKGVGTGYSIDQLSDPGTNARVTILGSGNGVRWNAWQTYVQGTYKQFL